MQRKTKECANLPRKVSSCMETGTGDRASSKGKDVPVHLMKTQSRCESPLVVNVGTGWK